MCVHEWCVYVCVHTRVLPFSPVSFCYLGCRKEAERERELGKMGLPMAGGIMKGE